MLPAACCLLPAACCLLPAACCLLPAACCLLPAACCLLPFFAWLSDKVGHRPLMVISTLAIALVTYPVFHLFNPQDFTQTVLGLCLISLVFTLHSATDLCAMAEIMPTRLRYTCLSVSLNIPVTLLGGTAPFIATWLVSRPGDLQSPACHGAAAGQLGGVTGLLRNAGHRPAPALGGNDGIQA